MYFALTVAAAARPWVQDRFVISFWVDPVVPPSRFAAEYARIAAANFSTLIGGFGATTPDAVALQVAAADDVGLAAIPSACGGLCSNATGAWGVQIADEPRLPQFASLAPAVAAAKASGKAAFVNLLPNYAGPAELGAPDYGTYVRQWVATARPNVLSVDHYPGFHPDPRSNKSAEGYIQNLLVLRDAALGAGYPLPFWVFFGAMPYNVASDYDYSYSEMSWQAMTAVRIPPPPHAAARRRRVPQLAIGAKGVMYFWCPPPPAHRRRRRPPQPPAATGRPPGKTFCGARPS